MYNRYIPQSDGSYHRKSVNHQTEKNQKPKPASQPERLPLPQQRPESNNPQDTGITGFLKQLLPKEFDTGDLLIILLLLLMAGDNEDEKSNALLTLALYFFM